MCIDFISEFLLSNSFHYIYVTPQTCFTMTKSCLSAPHLCSAAIHGTCTLHSGCMKRDGSTCAVRDAGALIDAGGANTVNCHAVFTDAVASVSTD